MPISAIHTIINYYSTTKQTGMPRHDIYQYGNYSGSRKSVM